MTSKRVETPLNAIFSQAPVVRNNYPTAYVATRVGDHWIQPIAVFVGPDAKAKAEAYKKLAEAGGTASECRTIHLWQVELNPTVEVE